MEVRQKGCMTGNPKDPNILTAKFFVVVVIHLTVKGSLKYLSSHSLLVKILKLPMLLQVKFT